MLKRKALNKIFFNTIVFFIMFTILTLNEINDKHKTNEKNIKNINYLYTITDDKLLAKTTIYVSKELSKENEIKEKLEIMIKDNNKNVLLPSYFNPIIPQNTKIEDVKIEEGIAKLYFSKELLNINEKLSEKMIEAITYSIQDKEILGIEIYVDNNMLKYIPNTTKELPTILTKDIGINKIYKLSNTNNIKRINLTYLSKNKGNYYETPVTKYINSKKEKLELIMDEINNEKENLNLITTIENIDLKDYKIYNEEIKININKKIDKKAKEEILKIIFNNYDVEKITILINNEKKEEKLKKYIEK